jgi:hypothetical protein
MIQCSCPECDYSYEVDEGLVGKTVLCPECQARGAGPVPVPRPPAAGAARVHLGLLLAFTGIACALWACYFVQNPAAAVMTLLRHLTGL